MLTTHTDLSASLGQKPHILKKLIRESGVPYDARNGVYILDPKDFEAHYKSAIMKSAKAKKEAKKKKTAENKKKKSTSKAAASEKKAAGK